MLIFFLQELFIFHPEKLPGDFEYQFTFPFEEINIKLDNRTQLNCLLLKSSEKSKGVVIYFKGNTRSIKGWSKYSKDFLNKKYDFFVMDYRGFGKSRGRRSEKNIQEDCMRVYDFIKTRYNEKEVIIYGRSIGSGFAAYVAARTNARLLILDSPYKSFMALAQRYAPLFPMALLIRYKIRTDKYLAKVNIPVYIIHGTKDRLIPFSHAKELARMNPRNTHLIKIKNGKHNNLPSFPDYQTVLYDILHGHYHRASLFEEVF